MTKFFQDSDEGNGISKCEGTYRYVYAIPLEEIIRYDDEAKMWQNEGY